jgi:hypothetical protein
MAQVGGPPGDVANLMAALAEFAANGLKRPDNAIDLRRPGIGYDQDSHHSPSKGFGNDPLGHEHHNYMTARIAAPNGIGSFEQRDWVQCNINL